MPADGGGGDAPAGQGKLDSEPSALFFPRREVLVVAFAKNFFDFLTHQMTSAFLRSTVMCDAPTPDATGACPFGLLASAGSCQTGPSTEWSGSAYCFDDKLVMNTAVKKLGTLNMAKSIGHFFALFVLGPLIDIWGRKAVMLTAIAGDALQLGLFALESIFRVQHVVLVLLPAVMIVGGTNAFNPAATSMVADLSKASVGGRANSFSTLKIVGSLGMLLAVVAAFAVLKRELQSYTPVWIMMASASGLLLAGAKCSLAETLPRGAESPDSSDESEAAPKAAVCSRGVRMVREVTRIVRKDRLLCNFILVQFFLISAFGVAQTVVQPFLMSHLHYKQSTAALAPLGVVCGRITGVWLSRSLLRRLGPKVVVGLALATLAIGFFICGLSGLDESEQLIFARSSFWVGFLLSLMGSGFGDTAGTVLLSMRVGEEALGAMFSLEHSLGLVGSIMGEFLGSRKFFDSKATGWARSFCFLYCSGFLVCALAWWVAACFILREEKAGDSEESSSAESEGDSE